MRFLYVIIALLFLGIIQACKHKEQTILGSPICASDAFKYRSPLEVNNSSASSDIDFTATPYATIKTSFNENVNWTVTITGQNSGAIKTYRGLSTAVDLQWAGNADGDIFFQQNENCIVSFQPSCLSEVNMTVKITGKPKFISYGLISDEDNLIGSGGGKDRSIKAERITPAVLSPQGGDCYNLYSSQGKSGWYIGYYGKNISSTSPAHSFIAGSSADDLYLNVYLSGIKGTVATLTLLESMPSGDPVKCKKNILINWIGWKMISVKLSDMNVGTPGNIIDAEVSVGPSVYNAETECLIDFMIFSKNKPYSEAN